jgi:hypothetical protein
MNGTDFSLGDGTPVGAIPVGAVRSVPKGINGLPNELVYVRV